MDDGEKMGGWLWRPGVPAGVKVPTVLLFSPYFGNLDSPGTTPNEAILRVADAEVPRTVIPVSRFVTEGFAVALVNVRGTGDSGGCYDFFGHRTALDGATVVEWLGNQGWSNGRVGMAGMSEDATAATATATHAPSRLKAVIAMSPAPDRFVMQGTPNGVEQSIWTASNYPAAYGLTGVLPPIYRSTAGAPYSEPGWALAWSLAVQERLCPEVREQLERGVRDPLAAQRDAKFWQERRHTDRFSQIKAATMITAGYNDIVTQGFAADAIGWQLLKAPKSMILGQWDHKMPQDDQASIAGIMPLEGEDGTTPFGEWEDEMLRWFGYWLKGVGGKPDALGRVLYQTDQFENPSRGWTISSSWPDAGVVDEALYLQAGDLPAPGSLVRPEAVNPARSSSFRSVPGASDACSGEGTSSRLFVSEPITAEGGATIAGNPFAYLRLSSDQPGGMVGVQLLELDEGFSCLTNPTAYQAFSWGMADLRFYDGSFDAEPFPTGGTKVNVRIDMETAARHIDKGHRIALLIGAGDPTLRGGGAEMPEITLNADGGNMASHVVLPVVNGGLGAPTVIAYPPRPNLASAQRRR